MLSSQELRNKSYKNIDSIWPELDVQNGPNWLLSDLKSIDKKTTLNDFMIVLELVPTQAIKN